MQNDGEDVYRIELIPIGDRTRVDVALPGFDRGEGLVVITSEGRPNFYFRESGTPSTPEARQKMIDHARERYIGTNSYPRMVRFLQEDLDNDEGYIVDSKETKLAG